MLGAGQRPDGVAETEVSRYDHSLMDGVHGHRKRVRRWDVPWTAHYLTVLCYRWVGHGGTQRPPWHPAELSMCPRNSPELPELLEEGEQMKRLVLAIGVVSALGFGAASLYMFLQNRAMRTRDYIGYAESVSEIPEVGHMLERWPACGAVRYKIVRHYRYSQVAITGSVDVAAVARMAGDGSTDVSTLGRDAPPDDIAEVVRDLDPSAKWSDKNWRVYYDTGRNIVVFYVDPQSGRFWGAGTLSGARS